MSSRFTVESAARWVEGALARIPVRAGALVTVETRGEVVYVCGIVTNVEHLRYRNQYSDSDRLLMVYRSAADVYPFFVLRFGHFVYDENQANNYMNHVLEMYAPFQN